MKNKTLVVNFFAGPGTGKSTMMAHVFAELKWLGVNCEMVTEYAKDKVWEGSLNILKNQLYIFAKQSHRLFRLNNKVDVIITDSPIPFSCIYGDQPVSFKNLVLCEFNKYNNLNIFLNRCKPYNPKGRIQNKVEAIELDNKIKSFLVSENIKHMYLEGKKESVKNIVDIILILERRENAIQDISEVV